MEIKADSRLVATDVMLEGPKKGSLAFLDARIKGHVTYSCELTVPRGVLPQGYARDIEGLFQRFELEEKIEWALIEKTENTQKFKIAKLSLPLTLGVEVKTFNMPVGTAIMQIKYYRAHDEANAWALVTDYDILDVEKETLDREDIEHASLSLEFDTYVREQMKKLNKPTITL